MRRELPPITEVKRLRLRPGDRLIVRTEFALTEYDADVLKSKVREILKLSKDIPILVLGFGADVEVVTDEPARPGKPDSR